ncbi:NADP-dependent oxidoreductase [Jatrophihabitans sp. YIM 134969]
MDETSRTTGRRVQFDHYGEVDVLEIVEVPRPVAGPGEVVVRMIASGLQPGEAKIRSGELDAVFPTTFPSGQGTDFAGVVDAVGEGVTGFGVGDEVVGWSDTRGAHADFVVSDAEHLVAKPLALDWIRAGSVFVAGVTAWAAVRAVAPQAGETVVVSGAAGGVGSVAVQLARRTGARVLAVAGAGNAGWLRSVGVEPVAYGEGLADRLRALAPEGIDAVVDAVGGGYVDLAIDLGVAPERINTIIDFEAAGRTGAKADGSTQGSSTAVLQEMVDHVAWGRVVLPIAAVYPFERIREAQAELEGGHTHGKIVVTTLLGADAGAVRPS